MTRKWAGGDCRDRQQFNFQPPAAPFWIAMVDRSYRLLFCGWEALEASPVAEHFFDVGQKSSNYPVFPLYGMFPLTKCDRTPKYRTGPMFAWG